MSLRRFQNFSLGALNASRLNELVDAVARLEARVNGMKGGMEPVRDRILAWVTGDGVATQVEGCDGSLPSVAYPFTQIFLNIEAPGPITGSTCVKYDIPIDAIRSDRGAFLLKFEIAPSLSQGDVVTADLAPMSFASSADDKQLIYTVTGGGAAGSLQLAKVTKQVELGKYEGKMLADNADIEFSNMYELEQYYGALTASIECAAISPNALPINSIVWVTKALGDTSANARYPDDTWFTNVSVAFGAQCTCGSQEGIVDMSLMEAGGKRDADAAVGAIMLDRSMRTI